MAKNTNRSSVTRTGLAAYKGRTIVIYCANYIYTGTFLGIDKTSVLPSLMLGDDAAIVYETGPLTDPNWKDAQPFGRPHNVAVQSIEGFGPGK
jgi:hypothetical protein